MKISIFLNIRDTRSLGHVLHPCGYHRPLISGEGGVNGVVHHRAGPAISEKRQSVITCHIHINDYSGHLV